MYDVTELITLKYSEDSLHGFSLPTYPVTINRIVGCGLAFAAPEAVANSRRGIARRGMAASPTRQKRSNGTPGFPTQS
jgi:hypothetical protein